MPLCDRIPFCLIGLELFGNLLVAIALCTIAFLIIIMPLSAYICVRCYRMAQLFSRSVGARHCRALFDLDESQILLPPFLGGWGDGATRRSHSCPLLLSCSPLIQGGLGG